MYQRCSIITNPETFNELVSTSIEPRTLHLTLATLIDPRLLNFALVQYRTTALLTIGNK